MKKLSRGERLWVAGLLFLALCLGVKSWWLDPWEPKNDGESAWLAAAQKVLAVEPDSWFLHNGIITERIVAIKEIPSEKPGDPPSLKITIRSYVGGYLPFGDRRITLPPAETIQ